MNKEGRSPADIRKRTSRNREDPSDRVDAAYSELRRVAARFRRRYPEQTLQTTELLHESYIRLAETGPSEYINQAHFFGSFGRAMHATLVDRLRRRKTQKRGGEYIKISFDDLDPVATRAPDFRELHDAINALNAFNPELREVFELRYCIGLSTTEVAAVVSRAESTVRRDCALARAWLQRELRPS
jgi:RNA polymerase sigma factor (TIGR02999 family)